MKKKYSLILDNEFIQFCELNNITDIDKMAKETFNKGFTILKYGETPKLLDKPTPPPTKTIKEDESPVKKKRTKKGEVKKDLVEHKEELPITKIIEPEVKQVIKEKDDDLYGE